jgi:murein L,D-transpeptidase YafK
MTAKNTALILLLMLFYVPASLAKANVDLVRVVKSERKLMLISEGQVIREFKVVLGSNPTGHKQQAGDQRTPEGSYILDYKKSDSAYYKAIHISYPNADDIASAKQRGVDPGGQIMIHGQRNGFAWLYFLSQYIDWTNGCIALKNSDMDVLWKKVPEGTKIEILP